MFIGGREHTSVFSESCQILVTVQCT